MSQFFKYLVVLYTALITVAVAQPVPSSVRSAAFLEAIATRGLECGLLKPWQASALRALNLSDMERWPETRRASLGDEIKRSLAERDCEDKGVAAWIEGASRGFDSEMLPPYLIVYRSLAQLENPPAVFSSTTTRLRYDPAIEAINSKLSALEASDMKPEGGGQWPEYIAGIEKAAGDFVATLANENAAPSERDQASVWIAQSAHIVELWLLEEEK